jgi:signal transduction histidine kinase/dsRNA-specific ribonuclease
VSNPEFRKALANLATKANCASFDIDLWELILTHESFAHEQAKTPHLSTTDDRAAVRLLDLLEQVGKAGVRLATYEYCLDKKGMDPGETNLCAQALGVVFESIADTFELLSAYRVGRGLRDLKPSAALKETIAGRFLGGVALSSSYENLRLLVWQKLESTLFLSSGTLSYANIDPKSWLQEYSQRYYRGKNQTFKLLSKSGPDHATQFAASVTLPDGKTARAVGATIKEAEKLAATALIKQYRLEAQMPSRQKSRASNSPDWKATAPPYLDLKIDQIDKQLMSSAARLAGKLGISSLSTNHLAVSLALPSSRYKGSFTNGRYKMLGDALEGLTFSIFAFQQLPARVFATKNISHLTAVICSQAYQAQLFDHLNLGSIVRTDPSIPISEQLRADVIKAIGASIYLSFRDFSRFFASISEKLGPWCRDTVTFLAENPAAISDPKTRLQEVLQEQKNYQAEYTGNIRSGPDHVPTFSTTLLVKDEHRKVLATQGVGKSLKAAQQMAALAALNSLIPVDDGQVLSPVANRFWRDHFDRLLAGEPGTIIGVCGVNQFQTLNGVAAYLELKAFSRAFPELSVYLDNPDFIDIIMRSIGRLTTASSTEALKVGKKGIALITSKTPDDIDAFTSVAVEDWLTEFRKASAGLKLPTEQLNFPLGMVPLADFRDVRGWNISVSGDLTSVISKAIFSHVLTFLELLEDDASSSQRTIQINAEPKRNDCQSVKLNLSNDWSRVHLEQLVERLSINAFFSGVQETIRAGKTSYMVDVKGVVFESDNAYTRAYSEIMNRLYRTQDHLRSLHRIVHDLKNQIIAIRNYAARARDEVSARYRMFAAIQELQDEIRERNVALGMYFRAIDESVSTVVNLQQLVREFMMKEIPLLPERIRPNFSENLESIQVMANKDLLISLLTNVTHNAIEAMPKGGRLSLSVSYKAVDSMLEIDISDTGVGIPPDILPDLFTSLKSTKKKGMGLGLATVKTIVEQHNGLIDVQSVPNEGTTFTILLPLKKASDAQYASTNR